MSCSPITAPSESSDYPPSEITTIGDDDYPSEFFTLPSSKDELSIFKTPAPAISSTWPTRSSRVDVRAAYLKALDLLEATHGAWVGRMNAFRPLQEVQQALARAKSSAASSTPGGCSNQATFTKTAHTDPSVLDAVHTQIQTWMTTWKTETQAFSADINRMVPEMENTFPEETDSAALEDIKVFGEELLKVQSSAEGLCEIRSCEMKRFMEYSKRMVKYAVEHNEDVLRDGKWMGVLENICEVMESQSWGV